jgi:hypothetical protein
MSRSSPGCGRCRPHPFYPLGFVLVLVACLPCTLHADGGEVRESVHAWLAAAAMDFDYKEYAHNARLDHEDGTLYGLAGGVQAGWNALLFEGELSWFGNDVNYEGQTQGGTPVQTRTDEKILDGQARAGWRFRRQEKLQYQFYGGLGYRDWQRDIKSTPTAAGVRETYTWWYGLLGGRGLYRADHRTTWLAEVQFMRPFDPEIKVDFKDDLDDTRLDLGSESGVRLSLAWQRDLESGWRLEIVPFYTAWDIGRSENRPLKQNGVVVGTVFEPRSEIRNYGIQARLGLSF